MRGHRDLFAIGTVGIWWKFGVLKSNSAEVKIQHSQHSQEPTQDILIIHSRAVFHYHPPVLAVLSRTLRKIILGQIELLELLSAQRLGSRLLARDILRRLQPTDLPLISFTERGAVDLVTLW